MHVLSWESSEIGRIELLFTSIVEHEYQVLVKAPLASFEKFDSERGFGKFSIWSL